MIENVAVPQGDALKVASSAARCRCWSCSSSRSARRCGSTRLRRSGSSRSALAAVAPRASSGSACAAGSRVRASDRRSARYAWTGLVSQAGITLGFASVRRRRVPGWGNQVQMLLVALIAIDELVGPAAVPRGLARAGELDARRARPLIVVSNREPYLHNYDRHGAHRRATRDRRRRGGARRADARARRRRGLRTAPAPRIARVVDAARQGARAARAARPTRCGACGSTEPTFSAYYGGFANEGLWPLCHLVDVRPQFRSDDWAAYQDVNARFAAAIDEELPTSDTPVFIQDYHLALVAPALRARRPAARTALFWHIPWPYPDRLRICPWRREILAGPAGQRPARVSARARSPEFPAGRRRRARRRGRSRGVARAGSATASRPSCRCRSASTTIASRRSAAIRRSCASSSAFASAFGLARRDHRPRRRSPRLHQGHSRAARRARPRCSRGGRSCAAG